MVRVAVQEYGVSNPKLLESLRQRGADVTSVPVYRWALPEDIEPLRHVLARILAGNVDVILITNAMQVEHIMQILQQDQQVSTFQSMVNNMIVASIGKISSERLRQYGLSVDLEPSHPKMGILVKETSLHAHDLLLEKRTPA